MSIKLNKTDAANFRETLLYQSLCHLYLMSVALMKGTPEHMRSLLDKKPLYRCTKCGQLFDGVTVPEGWVEK